jgi:nifR3 family TIM-barrel protein
MKKYLVYVAPMAGITNSAFRMICKDFGADMVYSEMISDIGIIRNNKKTLKMLDYDKREKPIAIQLFGNEPQEMLLAAKYVEKHYHPNFIDINCGCPAKKVADSKKAGSALMQNPNLLFNIVKTLVAHTKTPISVKIRSGWDSKNINAVEVAKLAEKAGASLITIHPRTKQQEFAGSSDWEIIKAIKKAVNIPVVGNGDIKNYLDAKKMFAQTQCDAIMIGRGVIGNPWLIKECKDYLEKGIIPKEISMKERIQVIIKHLKLLKKEFGDKQAVLLIRPHLSKYFYSIKNRKVYAVAIMQCKTVAQINKYLQSL